MLEISFLLIKNKSNPESWNEIWGTLSVGQLVSIRKSWQYPGETAPGCDWNTILFMKRFEK